MKQRSQPQNSHSNFGTIKKGMKTGPTRTQTAVAIKPNAMTTMAIAWAAASKMMMTTYMAVPRTSVIPGESMRISKSLWAVAVPAAAVARPLVAAAIAAFEMTAESCGATHLDRGHDTPLCR